ncbi:hypothetical protein L249_0927 [Ophiocordyceps polyrhachis-furcata BCC 54312]|uniref:Bys1 family protein n=1 Tax=Ophiocordyceps polyrhachis-furcata BCC 54312 TaxID=1330021 RepID=A0A367LCU2_9HYPO|nr:hypothetical protein L249_0927 [Ophiocordyceps polyrhachis-furcata BCC 54312]
MVSFTNVVLVAALASGASAVGKARVENKCGFPISLWSVGGSVSNAVRLATGGVYEEFFAHDATSGGRALKITRTPDGLFTGQPQTIFAYSLNGDIVFYDLSDVFGDDFVGNRLEVTSKPDNCEPIIWRDGMPPAGSQVKSCVALSDITLTMCA